MKILALVVVCLSLCSCGTVEEFEIAQRQFAFGEYERCVQNLKAGLVKDPDNDYFRCLKRAAQRRSAEAEYENALRLLEQKQLLEAEKALEKVLDEDHEPDHIGAQRKLSEIRRTKAQIKENLQAAQQDIGLGRWDEAYLALSQILPYQGDFPAIKPAYEKSKQGSFEMHFAAGQSAFTKEEYDRAVEEFKVALSRQPTSRRCLELKVQSNNYRNAQILARHGDEDAAKNNWESACDKYRQALAIVPSFRSALEGSRRAKQLWAEELYARGQKLLELGKAQKTQAFVAWHLLEKAAELQPEQENLEILSMKARQMCSEHLVKEAHTLLWESDFSRVGLAWYFLEYAGDLDPAVPGLPKLLATTRALSRLKFQKNIFLAPDDGKPGWGKETARRLAGDSRPYYAFTVEDEAERKQRLLQEVSRSLGRTPDNFPLQLWRLQLDVPVYDVASEESGRQTTASQYFDGLCEETDPLWDQYQSQLKLEKEKFQQLFGIYKATMEQYESSRISFLEVQYLKKAADRKLGNFRSLLSRMESWHHTLHSSGLNAAQIATELAQTLPKDIGRTEDELYQIQNVYNRSQAQTEHLYTRVAELERNLDQVEEAIENYQRYIDSHSRIRQVESNKNYAISQSQISLACRGKILARIENISGKTIGEFAHEAAKTYQVQQVEGAHEMDVKSRYNISPDLPSEEALARELEEKLLHGLTQKIGLFLTDFPLTLYENGIESTSPASMEKLVEFVELDALAHPLECNRANDILKDFAEGVIE